MKRELVRVVLKKYWPLLLCLFILGVGTSFISGKSSVSTWQDTIDYHKTPEYKKEGKKSFNEGKKIEIIESENTKTGVPSFINSYKDYKNFEEYEKSSMQFFLVKKTAKTASSYTLQHGSNPLYMLLCLSFLFAFLLLSFDNQSQFNRLLLKSKFSRLEILLTKLFAIMGTVLFTSIIGSTLFYLIVAYSVPAFYFNIPLAILIWKICYTCLFCLVFSASGILMASLVNKVSLGIVTSIGLVFSFTLFTASIADILVLFNPNFSGTAQSFWRYTSVPYEAFTYLLYRNKVLLLLIPFLLLVILSLATYWVFKRISLEQQDNYLTLKQLNVPVYIVFVFYTTFSLGVQGIPFGGAIPTNLSFQADWVVYGLNIVGVFLTSLLIGHMVLYKKFPLISRYYSFKKKINKA